MGCCSSEQATNASSGRPTDNNRARENYQSSQASSNRPTGTRSAQGNSQSSQSQPRRPANNPTGLRITYLQNPQVEIIDQTKAKGTGIKKTFAYDTPLTKEQLETWRKEFWETRTSGSPEVWMLLQSSIEVDEETALALISASGLQLPQDSLTTAIDSAGVYYRVPIACINDPEQYNQNAVLDAMMEKKAPKEKTINIKVRSQKGDKTLQTLNTTQVVNLKLEYLDELEIPRDDLNLVRFFCMGKELKDDLYLYSYDIASDMVVQAMFSKKQ